MNGGVSFTRNIILMSVRLKIRHRVLETWNNKWARNKEIENSQNWKGEQKDFDLAWLKQFCEFRKEKVCAWNVNWMNGGLASISNVAIKTLLASAPPAPCQPVPPPGRVASPRMDRMNTFTTITIIIITINTIPSSSPSSPPSPSSSPSSPPSPLSLPLPASPPSASSPLRLWWTSWSKWPPWPFLVVPEELDKWAGYKYIWDQPTQWFLELAMFCPSAGKIVLLWFSNIARITNAAQVTLWLSVTNPQCHENSFLICQE